MNEDKLDESIQMIENYFFGEVGDCGEKLFLDFARENKKVFLNAKLNESTENKFEFTQLHTQFQLVYENKLEEMINKSGMSIDEFYEGIRKVIKNN